MGARGVGAGCVHSGDVDSGGDDSGEVGGTACTTSGCLINGAMGPWVPLRGYPRLLAIAAIADEYLTVCCYPGGRSLRPAPRREPRPLAR